MGVCGYGGGASNISSQRLRFREVIRFGKVKYIQIAENLSFPAIIGNFNEKHRSIFLLPIYYLEGCGPTFPHILHRSMAILEQSFPKQRGKFFIKANAYKTEHENKTKLYEMVCRRATTLTEKPRGNWMQGWRSRLWKAGVIACGESV